MTAYTDSVHSIPRMISEIALHITPATPGENRESVSALMAQYPSSGFDGIRFTSASIRLAEANAPSLPSGRHKRKQIVFTAGPERDITASAT